jgi:Na+/H+ antiporter NhaD/arsenite permease-like protein
VTGFLIGLPPPLMAATGAALLLIPRTVEPRHVYNDVDWGLLVAGNLTITGSVANIIVIERAAAHGIQLDFREYLRVGLPVTIVTLLVGAVWLLLVR